MDRSAMQKDSIILCTTIIEGFKCKQTVGKFKASCEKKIVMSFSKYFNMLNPPAKKRYCEKLKLIDDIDPYAIDDENFTYNINCFPAMTYPDIVNYFVFVQALSQ